MHITIRRAGTKSSVSQAQIRTSDLYVELNARIFSSLQLSFPQALENIRMASAGLD